VMLAPVPKGPLHYVEEGADRAIPVVFLHGFPFSHQMWTPQLHAVGEAYRAIAFDFRGHGESSPGDGQLTIESHVEDLFSFLDFLHLPKAVIVGLSMGGYVALRAAEREIGRFSALVLCDTKSEADTNEDKIKRFAAMEAVKKNGSEGFADAFVKNVFAPESFKTKPEAVELIRGIIRRTPAQHIAATLLALAARTDTTAALSKINIPTLILVGEHDKVTPVKNAENLKNKISGSKLHVIPDAAHMSNLENPESFNEKLLKLLLSLQRL
jgi:3-oxoadipate enol-lactonase